MKRWPGKSSPLGATWDGAGVNFALFSERATKVESCLFVSPEGVSHGSVSFLHNHKSYIVSLRHVLREILNGL